MTKIAIVTGGSEGFGRAVSAALVEDGWTVVVDARTASSLAEAVRATGAVGVPGDVTDAAHREALVAEALGRGGLDLVVNNAGALGPSPLPPLAELPLGAFGAVLEANVVAPLALIQLALPHLRARGGAVVNVTSDAALEAYEGWGGYGASKAALEQLSHVLAAEEPEVLVWWVDPGDLRTKMHQAAFPGEDIGDRPEPETVAPALVDLVRARPPSGRVALRAAVTAGAPQGGEPRR